MYYLLPASLSTLVAKLAKEVFPSDNNGMVYVPPIVLDPQVTK